MSNLKQESMFNLSIVMINSNLLKFVLLSIGLGRISGGTLRKMTYRIIRYMTKDIQVLAVLIALRQHLI